MDFLYCRNGTFCGAPKCDEVSCSALRCSVLIVEQCRQTSPHIGLGQYMEYRERPTTQPLKANGRFEHPPPLKKN